MNTFTRIACAVAVGGFLLVPTSILAQDKKGADAKAAPAKTEKGTPKTTNVLENDKVKVFELEYKPGDDNKAVPSSFSRVVHAIKGGTLTRTYADGKTEKVEWKTGETRLNEPTKVGYTVKNTGKTDLHLLIVQLK